MKNIDHFITLYFQENEVKFYNGLGVNKTEGVDKQTVATYQFNNDLEDFVNTDGEKKLDNILISNTFVVKLVFYEATTDKQEPLSTKDKTVKANKFISLSIHQNMVMNIDRMKFDMTGRIVTDQRSDHMVAKKMLGDGACLFHSLYYFVTENMLPIDVSNDIHSAHELRLKIVSTMETMDVCKIREYLTYKDETGIEMECFHTEDMKNLISMTKYFDNMKKEDQYGTELEIKVFANMLNVDVLVVHNKWNTARQNNGQRANQLYKTNAANKNNNQVVLLYHNYMYGSNRKSQFEHYDVLVPPKAMPKQRIENKVKDEEKHDDE